MGDAFQHGPHQLRSPRSAGETEHRAARPEVPLGGAESEQGRDRDHATGVLAGSGYRVGLGGAGDDAEVFDKPVHGAAGGQHDGLDAPRELPVPLPGDDGEAAALAPDGEPGPRLAQAHVQHAPRTEGGLGQARPGAALTDQRRLLIADQRAQLRAQRQGAGVAERPGGVDHGREGIEMDAETFHRLGAPAALTVEAVEPGHGGVAGIGDVQPAAGQLPGQPAIDRAELGVLSLVGAELIQQPGELGRGLARREADPLGLQLQARPRGAQVLPAQPGPEWRPGPGVPCDGGRPLGRDGDRVDGAACFVEGCAGHVEGSRGHGGRVELHQAGHGHVRGQGPAVDVGNRGVGPHDGGADTAGPDVDHQDADGWPSLEWPPRPVGPAAWRGGDTSSPD